MVRKLSPHCIKFLILCLGLAFFFSVPYEGFTAQSFMARVERTIDGDTIKVRYKNKQVSVRLWGIDTPEYYQPYSKVARKFTANHVENLWVRLVMKDWDDYGRIIVDPIFETVC